MHAVYPVRSTYLLNQWYRGGDNGIQEECIREKTGSSQTRTESIQRIIDG
jgi:hypothetical protein